MTSNVPAEVTHLISPHETNHCISITTAYRFLITFPPEWRGDKYKYEYKYACAYISPWCISDAAVFGSREEVMGYISITVALKGPIVNVRLYKSVLL